MNKTLYILARRGLYQLTKCKNCGHLFECANCDAKLVTYRHSERKLELICHQCQSTYDYPNQCPNCHNHQIISRVGGIEELVENLTLEHGEQVIRLDKQKSKIELATNSSEHYVTTRLFDPSITYPEFTKIIFIQAENLLASPDYLVQEDVLKGICEVLLQVTEKNTVIFQTNSPDLPIFQELIKLNQDYPTPESVQQFYSKFLAEERLNREKYGFPPFKNLLLLTTQEKTKENSFQSLELVQDYLQKIKTELPDIQISSPYPAKFLKRRNMFSYHLLIRFPRQYKKFNELKKIIFSLAELYRLQVRLNPKHLF